MEFNIEIVKSLYSSWVGKAFTSCEPLPVSGSDRRYFRLLSDDTASILAVFNNNVAENNAYFSFTTTLANCGVNVPQVFAIDSSRAYYLVEDLGTHSLYDDLVPAKGNLDSKLKNMLVMALEDLAKMQVAASKLIDYSLCIPNSTFDKTAIQWDLNYFKYCFLKNLHIDFDEYKLEQDFTTIKSYIDSANSSYFMFRDFQSRNIMVKDDQLFYIDFQCCKQGPLTYDVASLLYQAKAQLSETLRNELFDSYIVALGKMVEVDKKALYSEFKTFALIRTLQVLGAYGYRGYYEKKKHFLESIPFALQNLRELLALETFNLPYLTQLAQKIDIQQPIVDNYAQLTITVYSFSYKKDIPADSENGGGFVFDCRGLHNPGRYPEYKMLTGRDKQVVDFLKAHSDTDIFLNRVIDLVSPTIENYISRNFKNLMVCFGCTGGQHRSVYCAQNFAEKIYEKYRVRVRLIHREQKITETFQ